MAVGTGRWRALCACGVIPKQSNAPCDTSGGGCMRMCGHIRYRSSRIWYSPSVIRGCVMVPNRHVSCIVNWGLCSMGLSSSDPGSSLWLLLLVLQLCFVGGKPVVPGIDAHSLSLPLRRLSQRCGPQHVLRCGVESSGDCANTDTTSFGTVAVLPTRFPPRHPPLRQGKPLQANPRHRHSRHLSLTANGRCRTTCCLPPVALLSTMWCRRAHGCTATVVSWPHVPSCCGVHCGVSC